MKKLNNVCQFKLKNGRFCKNIVKNKASNFCNKHSEKLKSNTVVNTCQALLKSGIQCKNPAKINGFCGLHLKVEKNIKIDKKRDNCQSLLKSGIQCKNPAKFNGFCGLHSKIKNNVEVSKKKDKCQALLKSGFPCKNPAKDVGYCGVHCSLTKKVTTKVINYCQGFLKSGIQCKNPSKIDGMCGIHFKQTKKNSDLIPSSSNKKTSEVVEEDLESLWERTVENWRECRFSDEIIPRIIAPIRLVHLRPLLEKGIMKEYKSLDSYPQQEIVYPDWYMTTPYDHQIRTVQIYVEDSHYKKEWDDRHARLAKYGLGD